MFLYLLDFEWLEKRSFFSAGLYLHRTKKTYTTKLIAEKQVLSFLIFATTTILIPPLCYHGHICLVCAKASVTTRWHLSCLMPFPFWRGRGGFREKEMRECFERWGGGRFEEIPGKASHRVIGNRNSQNRGFICEVVVSFRLKILYNWPRSIVKREDLKLILFVFCLWSQSPIRYFVSMAAYPTSQLH